MQARMVLCSARLFEVACSVELNKFQGGFVMKKQTIYTLLIIALCVFFPSTANAYSFEFDEEEAFIIKGMTAQETNEYISNLTEDEAIKFENDLINWIIDCTPRELGMEHEVLEDVVDMTYREMGLTPENLELPEDYAWTRPKSEFEQMTVEEQLNYLKELDGFELSESATRKYALHKYLRDEWALYDFANAFLELWVNKKIESFTYGVAFGATMNPRIANYIKNQVSGLVNFTLYPTDEGSLFAPNDPDYNIRGITERQEERFFEMFTKEGTIAWWDGTYTGELKGGSIPDGVGVWTRPDGARYEGVFVDGNFHGYGELLYPYGHVYKGYFHEGFRHGWGVYIKPDGEKYDGSWVNDRRNGRGTYIWADGSKYEGEMKDDMLHGQGKLTLPDGRVLSGEFRNNKFVD